MVLAVAPMTAGGVTTDGVAYGSAATVFTKDRLYLSGWTYARTDSITPGPPVWISTTGLTWNLITEVGYKNTVANRMGMAAYWAVATDDLSSRVTTGNFDYTAGGACWSIVEVTGGHLESPWRSASASTPGQTINNGATSTMITLPAAEGPDSRSFYFFASNTNVATWGLEAGYSLIGTPTFHANPTEILLAAWNPTAFDTTQSITNNTGSNSVSGMIALELRVAPTPSVSIAPGFLSLLSAA